ncbi:apolipoprotein L3-like isoform X2 [Trachinotus anak]|uniref:apolipoprotein L3-like isoform X2 n=1 Tax=Trachinotus anak TaxID=443729 RepID=UPI0039F22EA8
MSQNRPTPRRFLSLDEKIEDNKASSPWSPTKEPKGGLVPSTPPPVMPKKWTPKKSPEGGESANGSLQLEGGLVPSTPPPVMPKWTPKKSPEGGESANVRLELEKVFGKQANNYREKPLRLPSLPPKQESEDEILDASSLLDWWREKESWESLCENIDQARRIIPVKAGHLYKAIGVYILLLTEHSSTLKEYTSELQCIADNLNKVSKGTKIAGITGGASVVAGGVAAAAGVILSPVTLGASLALTAVGVGVAAAGGVTGASAAITSKVSSSNDKKKIDKILQEYKDLMKDIIDCLKFINDGMELLKRHGLSHLCKARQHSQRVASMVDLAATGGASSRALEANSKAFGLIEGFALALDFYYTQDKDGQKVKKGLESKFALKIRKLAEGLDKGLDELMHIKDLFSKYCQLVN